MKTEAFAKGSQKCRLLTRLLGQNLENFDGYGCPKIRDLVGEGEADSSWICSSYSIRHKTRLHCAERERESEAVWRLGNAPFEFVNFVHVFCICVYY